jgi:hypothetical protein
MREVERQMLDATNHSHSRVELDLLASLTQVELDVLTSLTQGEVRSNSQPTFSHYHRPLAA